ncbi:MAG TPA: NAD(P)-binding domain-containing protein, partial [Acidisoma sp.]|nr:NAD(P)-binding domain-containing protein [Acidisoma sp.]
RIAGSIMGAWVEAMPEGMFLKSEGFALDLFEPGGRLTLAAYCAANDIPYAHTGVPISKEIFIAYGRQFQKEFVPEVEERKAAVVKRTESGFETEFEDGHRVRSRRVVVAAGIASYARIPDPLQRLPRSLSSHSSEHSIFERFAGQTVAVIGGGSSAMDTAAALRRRGAHVTVYARRHDIRFQTPLGRRSVWDKLRAPMTSLGPGWKSVLCTEAPLLFHRMPNEFRTKIISRYLGPAPGWVVRDEVEGRIAIIGGTTVSGASVQDGRAHLILSHEDGSVSTTAADHVICATGFAISVGRTKFLDTGLADQIKHVQGSPLLTSHFESSVPGLYFIGPVAANAFGPMLRFACGAGFAARRVSRHHAVSCRQAAPSTVGKFRARSVGADA